jgi:hypothetical protein
MIEDPCACVWGFRGWLDREVFVTAARRATGAGKCDAKGPRVHAIAGLSQWRQVEADVLGGRLSRRRSVSTRRLATLNRPPSYSAVTEHRPPFMQLRGVATPQP